MADFDLSSLQGLLSQFQPSDEDKRRALSQALATAGFGILGAQGVNGTQAIGRGGLLGVNSYNNSLADASAGKRAGLQDAMGALTLKEQMQKFQDQDAFRKLQENVTQQYPLSGSPGMAAPQPPQAGVSPNTAAQFGPAAQAANAGMSGNAAPVSAPTVVAQTDGLARKRAQADAYRQQAAAYAQSANPMAQAMAQQLMDKADKVVPQIKETKTLTQNGKRVTVNFYTDGSHEVLSDVGPDMEKAVQLDVGNKIGAVDPFTLQPIAGGGMYNKSMTPGETASNQVALANLQLARQREGREAANANPNKPTFDPTAGQFIFPPSADNPTGRAVSPQGFTKPDKALTEQQGNAMLFGNRMAQANDILGDLSNRMDTTALSTQLADHPALNALASTDAQKLAQAKRNFMTAALRKESGASISASEYQMFDKTYFPQFGDKPATLKQKADLRANAIQNMQALAGGKNAQTKTQGWSVMRVD